MGQPACQYRLTNHKQIWQIPSTRPARRSGRRALFAGLPCAYLIGLLQCLPATVLLQPNGSSPFTLLLLRSHGLCSLTCRPGRGAPAAGCPVHRGRARDSRAARAEQCQSASSGAEAWRPHTDGTWCSLPATPDHPQGEASSHELHILECFLRKCGVLKRTQSRNVGGRGCQHAGWSKGVLSRGPNACTHQVHPQHLRKDHMSALWLVA